MRCGHVARIFIVDIHCLSHSLMLLSFQVLRSRAWHASYYVTLHGLQQLLQPLLLIKACHDPFIFHNVPSSCRGSITATFLFCIIPWWQICVSLPFTTPSLALTRFLFAYVFFSFMLPQMLNLSLHLELSTHSADGISQSFTWFLS